MTVQLAPSPVFRSWDNSGNPLAGGLLYTYAAGSTTPQATWKDATQSIQNTNPVVLNFRGEAFVWFDLALAYKIMLTDSSGNIIYTEDNIGPANVTSGSWVPPLTDTYNLGSPSLEWLNVYTNSITVSGDAIFEGGVEFLGDFSFDGNIIFTATMGGTPVTVSPNDNTIGAIFRSTGPQSSATPQAQVIATDVLGSAYFSVDAANGTPGTDDLSISQDGSTRDAFIVNNSSSILNIGTHGVTNIEIAGPGNVTINAPTAGIALTVNGLATLDVASFQAAATNDFGLVLGIGAGQQWALRFANLVGAFTIHDDSAGQSRFTISTTGNINCPAPSTGSALSVDAFPTAPAITVTHGPIYVNLTTAPALAIRSSSSSFGLIQNVSSSTWGLAYGTSNTSSGTNALIWGDSGNITINAPSSGNALNVTGHSGSYATVLNADPTTSNSFGLQVRAGSNSSDIALQILDSTFSAVHLATIFGDGGMTLGTPTGGDQGLGTLNVSSGLFVNGVSLSSPAVGANPTASLGLTAVNGSATTFLRSDGAPALSQAIVPTWTGIHTFSARPVFSAGITVTGTVVASGVISGSNFNGFANPSATIGLTAVNGSAITATRSDGAPALSQAIVPTWTGIHTFSATPVFSAGISVTGNVVATGTLSGSNFNGFANPSASIGLSAVNGTAITAMRSDGAPALSQSITPTWTGAHTFNSSVTIGTTGFFIGNATNGYRFNNAANTRSLLIIADAGTVTFGNTTDNPTYGFTGTGATTFGGITNVVGGSASGPGLRFTGTTTGLYQIGGTTLGLTSNGVNAGSLTAVNATFNEVILSTSGSTFGSPTGGVQGTGTVNTTGLFINGVGVPSATAPGASGSFTGTLSGFGSATTGTVNYYITGGVVTLYILAAISGTSNGTGMTMTGLAGAVTPVHAQGITTSSQMEDATAQCMGAGVVDNSGTITFQKAAVSGTAIIFNTSGWTNTGTKGLLATWTVQYTLT